MFGQIGPLEIALVLIIALIVFGPKRLPELGKSLGKGLNEFRDGMSNLGNDDDDDDDDEDLDEAAKEQATLPPGENVDPDDPAVHEITDKERTVVAEQDAETVDAEVVPERRD
jgi:sec-independent protein translocase protein TatA